MNLDEFLTNALIESLNNGLIAPELIVVYAGNYLAKSLITADEMTQVQNAVASYKAEQTSNSTSTSESSSNSESTPSNAIGSTSASASESASASAVASESASTPTSEPASASASEYTSVRH